MIVSKAAGLLLIPSLQGSNAAALNGNNPDLDSGVTYLDADVVAPTGSTPVIEFAPITAHGPSSASDFSPATSACSSSSCTFTLTPANLASGVSTHVVHLATSFAVPTGSTPVIRFDPIAPTNTPADDTISTIQHHRKDVDGGVSLATRDENNDDDKKDDKPENEAESLCFRLGQKDDSPLWVVYGIAHWGPTKKEKRSIEEPSKEKTDEEAIDELKKQEDGCDAKDFTYANGTSWGLIASWTAKGFKGGCIERAIETAGGPEVLAKDSPCTNLDDVYTGSPDAANSMRFIHDYHNEKISPAYRSKILKKPEAKCAGIRREEKYNYAIWDIKDWFGSDSRKSTDSDESNLAEYLEMQMLGCKSTIGSNFNFVSNFDPNSQEKGVTKWGIAAILRIDRLKPGCVERAIYSAGGPANIKCPMVETKEDPNLDMVGTGLDWLERTRPDLFESS